MKKLDAPTGTDKSPGCVAEPLLIISSYFILAVSSASADCRRLRTLIKSLDFESRSVPVAAVLGRWRRSTVMSGFKTLRGMGAHCLTFHSAHAKVALNHRFQHRWRLAISSALTTLRT
jgi:hypothetical protein